MAKIKAQRGSMADYLSGKTDLIQNKEFVFRLITNPLAQGTSNTVGIKSETGLPIQRQPQSIQACGTIDFMDSDGTIRQRKIRYYDGAKSIFVDEQPNDKDFPKKKTRILFENDIKVVLGKQTVLLDFLMMWDLNLSKPANVDERGTMKTVRDESKNPKFFLIDNKKAVAKFMDNDKLFTQAKAWVYDGDRSEVLAYARLKGCDMTVSDDEIRGQLIGHINPNNPEKFMAEKDNPTSVRKYIITVAIDRGYLVHNTANRTIAWGTNTAQPILAPAPFHIDPIDELVRYTFSEQGEILYARLHGMVLPQKQQAVKVPTKEELKQLEKKIEAPLFSMQPESDDEIEAIINEGISLEIINDDHKAHYKFMEKSYGNKAKFIATLKSDEFLLPMIKRDIKNKKAVTA